MSSPFFYENKKPPSATIMASEGFTFLKPRFPLETQD